MTANLEDLPSLSTNDLNGLNRSVFEWADSLDTKDWERLAANLAPELYVDYRALTLSCWPKMSAAEYIRRSRNEKWMGNPAIQTQHLIGASYYKRITIDEVEARHQIRAFHQIHNNGTLSTATLRGHGASGSTHWYRKIDGVWKLSGIRPSLYWTEKNSDHDFEGVMVHAAGSWMTDH